MKMVILRGIPGSGKSTYARKHCPTAVVCSADDFFTKHGVYEFQPHLIGKAHAACFKKAILAASEYYNMVIDNTNTTVWEMAPYVQLAAAYDMDVEILRIHCDPLVAAQRNVHGVPKDRIRLMHDRMEDLLPFWPREEMVFV